MQIKKFQLAGLTAISLVCWAMTLAPSAAGRDRGGGLAGGGARPNLGGISGGGGGGRPNLGGGGGGGGGRPNLGGGGGAAVNRPNLGGGGGGAASRPGLSNINRPSAPTTPIARPGGGGSPPSLGGISRPNVPNRPGAGGITRPTVPPVTRPSIPDRPNLGGNRPTLPNRPDIGGGNRPSLPNRPDIGGGNRPTLPNRPDIGGGNRPSLPGIGGGDRPSFPGIGGGDRPSFPDRPGLGGGDRPSFPNRPSFPDRPGGGDRPSFPDRPSIGGPGRPPLPDRPNLPDRPGIGGPGRPPFPDRPTLPDRPGIGRPDRPTLPDRPIIGGPNRPNRPNWPDRPIIGGGNNNNNNNVNININRPGWGWNPGWGWGHPAWNNRWHWHHPWYHGSWNGHWWNHWYRPPAAFFVGWGLGSWSSPGVFVNPYFVPSATAPFDYSQPIVINNFVTAEANATATADAQNTAAMQLFEEGMTAFRAGQYEPALAKFDQSLTKLPGDPVLHEMRALTYFALGRFQPAAAVLNSLLAAAPGMDWTTLSSLYGNLDDYTTQLRALEAHVDANPNDAAALFLLSYHYLVMGHDDQAIELLRRVVKIKPNDTTAQRLLRTLEGPAMAAPAATGADAPETDLVGRWQAVAGDTTIDLTIDEESRFGWTATQKGKPPVSLAGNLTTTSDLLILDTDDQGSMVGQVISGGADKFQFVVAGGPPTESGLSFQRQK